MTEVKLGGKCPSCGAPVKSEICPYCGTKTGFDTATAEMEYPVIKCKEMILDFWSVGFPLIFALAFGTPGALCMIAAPFVGIPFSLIGFVSAFLIIRRLIGHALVKAKGRRITGIVYGYMDDDVYYNNEPGKVAKILVDTKKGKRFLLYQVGGTETPYKINRRIELLVYGDKFLVENADEGK